jgi:DNA-binding CsgD family transcriptional regulator
VVNPPAPAAVDPAFAAKAREEWRLTPREIEVAWLSAQGMTRRGDIARWLGISLDTVKNHRTNIRQKMAIESWADHHGGLLAMRALGVYEPSVRMVELGALADDLAALERLVRGVMAYLDGGT